MSKYLQTNKDRQGVAVRVECAFKSSDGKTYLLLRRMPPEYAAPPVWMVEMSSDTLLQKDPRTGESQSYLKLYSIQVLNDSEKQFLLAATPGKSAVPFFNFSYPNVIRILGKRFYKANDHEIGPLIESKIFVLVAERT